MALSTSIKNNIRTAFEKQMSYGRAVSNDPYIHLCRVILSGGDAAMGTDPTEIYDSQYFVAAYMDNPKITEVGLKFETSVAGTAQTIFYIPSMPVYYTDTVEYGPEMRTNAHLYDTTLICDSARFQSNGIKIGDSIKIFSNDPITGGDYLLDSIDTIVSIASETQVELSGGIGITGVTRAYSINTHKYDIITILPDDEFNYTMINTERVV